MFLREQYICVFMMVHMFKISFLCVVCATAFIVKYKPHHLGLRNFALQLFVLGFLIAILMIHFSSNTHLWEWSAYWFMLAVCFSGEVLLMVSSKFRLCINHPFIWLHQTAYLLGFEVKCCNKGIFFSLNNYTQELINMFEINRFCLVDTPMALNTNTVSLNCIFDLSLLT